MYTPHVSFVVPSHPLPANIAYMCANEKNLWWDGTFLTTQGNCQPLVTGTSNDSQTGAGYWPCLNPAIFNPVDLDPEQWMQASASLGMK